MNMHLGILVNSTCVWRAGLSLCNRIESDLLVLFPPNARSLKTKNFERSQKTMNGEVSAWPCVRNRRRIFFFAFVVFSLAEREPLMCCLLMLYHMQERLLYNFSVFNSADSKWLCAARRFSELFALLYSSRYVTNPRASSASTNVIFGKYLT